MSTPTRIAQRRTYLMCRPEHFTVSYTINPWMEPANPTDTAKAVRQWQDLYDAYIAAGHEVHLIDPIEGLPDMVYTANGGFVIGGTAYGAKFRFQERVPEGPAFMDWFRANGFEVAEPVEVNEGEGDFLLVGDTILAGTGFRSTGDSHRELRDVFGKEVVSLTLVDPRFYHLDTAIAVLDPVEGDGGVEHANIAYLPHAFDDESQRILAERYPDAIKVSDEDGAVFGLNSSSDGYNVIISPRAKG
ncbi:MAG: dimethylargininase, partial [Microbacteriaceae bacterium]